MIVPTVVQPRPINVKPQQQLATLEAAQSDGTLNASVRPAPGKVASAPAAGAAKPGVANRWPPKQPAKTPASAPSKAPAAAAAKKAPIAKASTRTFARASFDHVPQDHLELALQKGDIIEILTEDDSGWWKASKLGKIGIVPAPYIEKLPPNSQVAKAVFPFDAPEPTDLKLVVGEFALLLSLDGDWWEAQAHGDQGSVPSNYIEKV